VWFVVVFIVAMKDSRSVRFSKVLEVRHMSGNSIQMLPTNVGASEVLPKVAKISRPNLFCYLHQGGYVFTCVILFVCLSISQSVC